MAAQENNQPVKRQFLFNPLKRPMPYIGLMLAILIVIFQGTLRMTIADLVGSWLVSNIKESTEGMYTIDYDIVRFDVFTRELRIQNLELELDTSVTNANEFLINHNNLIDVSTPLVVLKLESLWDLIQNDKLKIAYIGMQNPRVNLIRSESQSQEKSIQNRQEASERVRSYLEELEIDSFRILNGTVNINLQSSQREELIGFKIRDFSTLLKGFKLDQIRYDKPFQGIHAEFFELEVKDQELIIPGIEHEVKFNRLWLSTIDSVLQLDTLKVIPTGSSNTHSNTELDIQNLTLGGIDYKKLYDNLELEIRHLELVKPKMNYKIKNQVTTQNNASSFVKNIPLKSLNISLISIDSGSANLRLKHNYELGLFNSKIFDFNIDSAELAQEIVVQKFKDFNIESFDNSFELPDSIHELRIGYLNINSSDSSILANNTRFNPITDRRKYSLYSEKGVKYVNYGTARNIFMNGIEFHEIMNNQQLIADSLIVISPNVNTTEYPYIVPRSSSNPLRPFLIHHVLVSNGNINYNKRQNRQNHRTELMGINIDINNLYPDRGAITFDNIEASIKNGFNELKSIGHTIRFEDLRTNNLSSVRISSLQINPDSSNIEGEKLNIDASGIQTSGLELNQFIESGNIKINRLSVNALNFNADYSTRRKKTKNSNSLNSIKIHYFNLDKGNFNIEDHENTFNVLGTTVYTDSIVYQNTADSHNLSPVDFHELLFTFNKINFKSKNQKLDFTGQQGSFSETDSLISASGIDFNLNNIKGKLDKLTLKGFDHNAFFNRQGLHFNYLLAEKPSIKLDETIKKREKNTNFNADSVKAVLLNTFTSIDFDSIIATNADMVLESNDRTTQIKNVNTYIRNYRFDSSSTSQEVLSPEDLKVTVHEISSISSTDSIKVQRVTLDMVENSLFTGDIRISANLNNNKVTASIPGVLVNGFNSVNLLNGDYTLDTIRTSNAEITLNTTDTLISEGDKDKLNQLTNDTFKRLFSKSENLKYDTVFNVQNYIQENDTTVDNARNFGFFRLMDRFNIRAKQDETQAIQEDSVVVLTLHKKALATHGIINYIRFGNSRFNWLKNGQSQKLINNIDFSITVEELVLDSLNQFNIFNHLTDINVDVFDYQYKLPDSLNIIAFDELSISSEDESIKLKGVAFIPRVDKYEYANIKGYEASWQHLHDLDIEIKNIDLQKLITEQEIRFGKITTTNGVLELFKDKELEIPADQYRPMPQEGLKNIKTPILVDSIEVNNFRVNYSSRLSSAEPEGSIEIHEINGVLTNIVNTDSAIAVNPYALVKANAKLMGKGLLTADFTFDLFDEHNNFIFDAHLSEMDANAFNDLLEATAYVKVSSGTVKDLKLNAEGDDFYATGSMRFAYNNLKVATISRKNLKTKGMGNVIRSFFANSFVVKKNNPSVRFFPREGAMYYERDTQKIIFDYAVKTALSGIVSSIGGRNARKDIKKMQKEDKKTKDEERKATKRAARRISSAF